MASAPTGPGLPQPSTVDPAYKPRRINKAIGVAGREHNQSRFFFFFFFFLPLCRIQRASGAPDPPMRKASAWARPGATPSITRWRMIRFSHGRGLRNFMQGLVDGGPTPSGHRTPDGVRHHTGLGGCLMVPQCAPMSGRWPRRWRQGAHGVLICEMESAEAAQIAVAGARYKWTWPGVKQLPLEGCRGAGSWPSPPISGASARRRYNRVADIWPHNPPRRKSPWA